MAGIREFSAEALLLGGGGAAILLQVADPTIAAGVAHHSDFATRPLDRLHGTLTYLYVTEFGTPDEAAAIARSVGRAHRPVPGAQDDALQLWVAATLYRTAVDAHRLVLGPEPADLLPHFARVGTALGMPAALWPADDAAFDAYWTTRMRELTVGDDARSVARDLLHPRTAPAWLRAALPVARLATAGLLPPELREAYGLPFDQRRFDRMLRVARAVYPRLPRTIRHAPLRRTLRRFRAQR